MVFMSILISDYIVFTLFDALVQFFILIQLMLQHHILGMHGYGQSIQYMEIVSVHKYIIHKYYTILNSQTNVYFTERAGWYSDKIQAANPGERGWTASLKTVCENSSGEYPIKLKAINDCAKVKSIRIFHIGKNGEIKMKCFICGLRNLRYRLSDLDLRPYHLETLLDLPVSPCRLLSD